MSEHRLLPIAVFISGGGTTLTNLCDRIQSGDLPCEIKLVISSKPHVRGVALAQERGLPCHVVQRKEFASVAEYSAVLFDHCRRAGVELVVLGGFLSLIHIPNDFEHRVMNIHPSLIPAFSGKGFHGGKVHQAVVDRGVKVSGCTVHFADNEYDHGPIILQRTVPVSSHDSADDVARRVFEVECEAYPEAIQLFAEGRIRISDTRVEILDEPSPSA